MGKRKHKKSNSADKENRLAKKMKRLMKKLRKYENRTRRSSSSSSDSEEERGSRKRQKIASELDIEELSQSPSHSPPDSPRSADLDLQWPSNETPSQEPMEVTSGRSSPNSNQNSGNNITTQGDTSANSQPIIKPSEASSSSGMQKTDSTEQDGIIIEDLDVEILEAIGKRVAEDRILAPAIPKSIAIRLEDILKKGLPKEERENLLKAHAPPKNCVLIDPPKLNEEIKVSLQEASRKRDERIVEKQKKITACLAMMGSSIVDIINNNRPEKDPKLSATQIALIKKLSEAARLMADLQRDETLTRRSLILAAIGNSQKETLESQKADEWLFGEKLGERLKAAKSIERSGKDLKVKSKSSGKSKNFKTPPRRQPFRPRMSGGYRNKTSYNHNQSNKKNWKYQNKGDRNNQTQTPTQQKKT